MFVVVRVVVFTFWKIYFYDANARCTYRVCLRDVTTKRLKMPDTDTALVVHAHTRRNWRTVSIAGPLNMNGAAHSNNDHCERAVLNMP